MTELSETARRRIVEALVEDIGSGDRTTQWCVPDHMEAEAEIIARAPGVVAGLSAAACVFEALEGAELTARKDDGDGVEPGDRVAHIAGSARTILTGERTALNLLGHLSGVATLTRRFVDAVAGTGARITDTRKTTPLWRELERAATRAAGAVNHRWGLDDMVLIKENHLAGAGGIGEVVRRVTAKNDLGLDVEVETTSLEEVEAALAAGVDRIMLDNMSAPAMQEAVSLIRERHPHPEIEASGGVTLATVRAIAETGVDYISVGALTHSAPALDLSLRIVRLRA
jgi:nicotinate-nucleotide pyrophosphorylase (carboxylating)